MTRIYIFEGFRQPSENRSQAGLLDVLFAEVPNIYDYVSEAFGPGLYLVIHQACFEGEWAFMKAERLNVVPMQVQVEVKSAQVP